MTEFYFVRHGQTTINRRKAFNGGLSDSPLTTLGVTAAQEVGQALSSVQFTQVLASSMPRAVATANWIMAANEFRAQTPLQPVAGLREMKLGQWDGRTVAEVNDDARVEIYMTDTVRFDAEVASVIGSETYRAALTRSLAVIQTARATYPTGKILVVGHGIIFLLLLNTLVGVRFSDLRHHKIVKNATVTKLVTRDGKNFEKRFWGLPAADLSDFIQNNSKK
ncbi:histidine phosphatase family protein [Lacticaseibacillus mingshuiensis]|uniref:Histidine phosphatase family protein n=1 Tax=Lacticaseibacillus mingshuiensis TaxID=2799574 RepID=A0ABW4CH55_9LACO|nr:histidine phosphatase family protein [Lacticaseibacillus mingshuiensis]